MPGEQPGTVSTDVGPGRIRPATEADWPAIWPIFAEVVRAGQTYIYPRQMTSEQGRASWLARPPGQTAVLHAADGQLLGTATMGPNRPGPGSHIGTGSFMVAAGARGRGVGRALGEYVIGWHYDQGYRGIQFNAVVQTNTAAVRLWQSLGFEIVGTVPGSFDHPTHGYVAMHVMFLSLVP